MKQENIPNLGTIESSAKTEEEIEIARLEKEMDELIKEIAQLEEIEKQKAAEQKEIISGTIEKDIENIEELVSENIENIEEENTKIFEEKIEEIPEKENKNNPSVLFLKKYIKKAKTKLEKKMAKYIYLPVGVASFLVLSYVATPQKYIDMFNNWKERHIEKIDTDDPNIVGIDSIYKEIINGERTTYDFLGEQKIDYKSGYYCTSVFDLSDKTPPQFKIINDRENYTKIDSAAGITTNLFKKFQKFSDFKTELKGHTERTQEKIGDIPVIGYNKLTRTIKAGHYKDFDDNWLVSETYEIPLNFKLNPDGTINLAYHDQAMRMVPLTTNEKGQQIPFPIGVTYNKNITKIKPNECTHFGTLEGGKVIMVCGNKQLQVNGSFADIFKIYERLQKENKGTEITVYLLDNGSYNLPMWNKNKDNILTEKQIAEHLRRNPDGGIALVLINNGRISPYEYKNKYKEFEHYTPNYTLDSITKKPAVNEKSVIVLHHTGNYGDPNQIIKEFEDTTTGRSSHVLILKDGTRHLFNNDNYVLGHAGKSDFNDKNKVNYFSIGIEMEGDSRNNHQFTTAQLESMLEFIHPRIEKYKISLENITTHKIIRDNYIKKHPTEKNVPIKTDLDDKVWEQIKKLIQKKFYAKDIGETKITDSASKLLGSLAYQDTYRLTRDQQASILAAEQILNNFDVSKEQKEQALYSVKI